MNARITRKPRFLEGILARRAQRLALKRALRRLLAEDIATDRRRVANDEAGSRQNPPGAPSVGSALALLLALFCTGLAPLRAEGLQLRGEDGLWLDQASLETQVHFEIRGLLAEVEVRQIFVNNSELWLEGRYLLPLPEQAAVHGLSIEIGDRIIEGEVQEKAEAKATYTAAAAAGQSAGLIEQNRPNLFQTRLANIGPGERIDLRVRYAQRVGFDAGEFLLRLPLALTPRYHASGDAMGSPEALPADASTDYDLRAVEPIVGISVDLQPGLALAEVGSPTHALDIDRKGERYLLQLTDGVVLADREFELRWRPLPQAVPQTALFIEPGSKSVDGADYALLMIVPPTAPQATPLPRELVLVIDVSGSMSGLSMDSARRAAQDALDRLRPGDRFNVIRFNQDSESLFDTSRPALPADLAVAERWIASLYADGGTEMLAPLRSAFAGTPPPGHVRQVVFITDAAVSNEGAILSLIEDELGDARLFPVGIGNAPNDWLLRRSAELGRGSSTLIRSPDDIVESMGALFERLDHPALAGIALEFSTAADVHPAALPDLYVGEPLFAVARMEHGMGDVKARGLSADGEFKTALALRSTSANAATGLSRLWARGRLEDFEDTMRRGTAESELKPAMLELALQHGLVSRYTSLVAVDRTPIRPEDAALAALRFDNAAPAGSLAFANGSTGARSRIGGGIALLLLGIALLRRREPESIQPALTA